MALCVAIGSIAGTLLVVRLGNKLVVTSGLLSLALAYADLDCEQRDVVRRDRRPDGVPRPRHGAHQRAGHGVHHGRGADRTGGTLGVAVIGSVVASLYATQVDGLRALLPPGVAERAGESVGAAFAVAAQLPEGPAAAVRAAAERGFFDGLAAGCLVASGVALAGAVVAALALPARPQEPSAEPTAEVEPAASLV